MIANEIEVNVRLILVVSVFLASKK